MSISIKRINSIVGPASYLKLAGVGKFILMDVYRDRLEIGLLKNKEAVYKLSCSLKAEDYEISVFAVKNYSGGMEEISSILKEFVKKNEADDAYLILGINEYRTKTLTVDRETEDINLWFLENTDKFIPQGRPAKEFCFAYEKYNEDEDNYSYLVAFTREEYLNRLVKACENCGVKILSAAAFPLSFHSLKFVQDVRAVFIKITGDVIKYSYTDVNNNLFVNELYHNMFVPEEEGGINKTELESSINQIAEAVKIASAGNTQGELHLYLSVDKIYFDAVSDSIGKILSPVGINKGYEKIDPAQLGMFFGLLKELTHTEDKINFLNDEIIVKERDDIEKQITLRVTLASGAVLISLLLVLFMLESFISGKIKAGQEDLLEVNANNSLITQFEGENSKINLNLVSLKKMKEKKSTYSSLFEDLSGVVTSKSCFTNLRLMEDEKNHSNLSITGLALNRQEVAMLMKNMEDNEAFSNILLSYSNSIATEDLETSVRVNQKEVIEYRIICEFNNAD